MNADGSGQRNLAPSPSSQEFGPAAGRPTGGRSPFATDRDGNWEIYAMNADGSNPRNLTRQPVQRRRRSGRLRLWSPDGRKIAFASTATRATRTTPSSTS